MDELRYQVDLLTAMNEKLKNSEQMYRCICENSDYALLHYSFARDEITTMGRFRNVFDFDVRTVRDFDRLLDAMDPDSREPLRMALFPERGGEDRVRIDCLAKDRKHWLRAKVGVYRNEQGEPTDKVISFLDITKEKKQNSELLYMAYYDSLTGIYNRNYFVSLLGGFLARAKKEQKVVSLMLMDIDGFKRINDSLGMVVGDEVLQQFGLFLRDFGEDGRVLACHLANDVFCLAIYDPVGKYSVEEIHDAIYRKTRNPFRLSTGQDVLFTVSIGVAEYPEAGTSALELINCAEIVMFRSKAAGKGQIQYFEAPILDDFLRNVDMENRLKEAVFHHHFRMFYQPQYNVKDRTLRGMEALIRWRDEHTEELISPAVFIPIAEKNGSIVEIGKFVMEESIRQYAEWSRRFDIHFQISINISALQYKKDDFVDSVMHLIRKYQVDPSDIELEITESILIDDFDAVTNKLNRLRSFGLRISMDDFGTGYSSLSYLKRFPIDTLKVDKSFIDTVLGDSSTRIITDSILQMSRALGFETIAEGVEDEQQYRYLANAGCDVIQGFYFGRPSSPQQIEELLRGLREEERVR